MQSNDNNCSLELLEPVPDEQMHDWLEEFYGKRVRIEKRELLRHRDFSYVERLWIKDSLPNSLIYKLVLPPWDIEQDLHERILIPSISNSAQLYLTAHYGRITALFLEDLGNHYLLSEGKDCGTKEIATKLGEEMAKLHRAYSYRTDELMQIGVLRALSPIDYVEYMEKLCEKLSAWNLITSDCRSKLPAIGKTLAVNLAGEPISLTHGDLFAENIILRSNRIWIIDWSWFAMLGVPLLDLATITMEHFKNGSFVKWRMDVIEAYCYESARQLKDVENLLPLAEKLARILFLEWLVVRRQMGVLGTTVGPVDNLIPNVVQQIVA